MNQVVQSVIIVTPIIFVLALGFFAGKFHSFGKNNGTIPIINDLVLNFALPASLFVGTVTVSRSALEKDLVLFFALLIALLLGYGIGFCTAKFVFKRNIVESAIAALGVAFSAGPFYGPALLGGIYGADKGGVAISLISLVLNVVIVPLTTIIIKIELERKSGQHDSISKLIGSSVYQAIFKTPFVWAPLLGFVFVFIGLSMPTVVLSSLKLIGQATAGVAVFVAGMTIAANKFTITGEVVTLTLLKNIALPLIFFGIALMLQMSQGTTMFNQGLLLAALPSGPMIVLLSTRYKQYQKEASSILALSTVGMLITVTALIMILHL